MLGIWLEVEIWLPIVFAYGWLAENLDLHANALAGVLIFLGFVSGVVLLLICPLQSPPKWPRIVKVDRAFTGDEE